MDWTMARCASKKDLAAEWSFNIEKHSPWEMRAPMVDERQGGL